MHFSAQGRAGPHPAQAESGPSCHTVRWLFWSLLNGVSLRGSSSLCCLWITTLPWRWLSLRNNKHRTSETHQEPRERVMSVYIYIILWYFIYIIYIIWWYFIYYIYFQNFICLLGMQSLQSGHKAFGPPHKLRYKTFHIMLLTGKGPWIWRGLASNSVQSGGGTSKVKPPLRYKVPLWARIFLRELCVKNETETASDMFQPLPSTCSDISCLEAS